MLKQKSQIFINIIIILSINLLWNYAKASNLQIIVTIKPLYNLVAAITQKVDNCKVDLLLKGNVSPHDYTLKPSDINSLNKASIVIWGGDQLETFLVKLFNQPKFQAKLITVQALKDLQQLKFRNSSYIDEHWWLSPYNAKVIAVAIEQYLSRIDPKNAKNYKINRKKFLLKLAKLDLIIKEKLEISNNKNYLVFHDAYQYFEKFYGLKSPVVISDNPAMPLSIRRMSIVRELIDKQGAKCLFREPQFSSKALDSLIGSYDLNRQLKVGILDPLGSDQDLGPDGYFKLINNLADSFNSCFKD